MSFIISGRVWKFGDNISTDLIMPSINYTQAGPDEGLREGRTEYVMHSNRPGWAEKVLKGDLIVAGKNFGCGSSRPAADPLKALGISCVVAESISRIFFRNAISIGLPAIAVQGIQVFCNEMDILTVNLKSGEITNLTSGKILKTNPMPEDSPPMQILRAGGVTTFLKREYLN